MSITTTPDAMRMQPARVERLRRRVQPRRGARLRGDFGGWRCLGLIPVAIRADAGSHVDRALASHAGFSVCHRNRVSATDVPLHHATPVSVSAKACGATFLATTVLCGRVKR